MRLNLRKKDKPSTERRSSKTVDDYTCINGKKLSEQTIYDYAQFIPHWDTGKEIGDECFEVRCVNPHNHRNMDEHPSMMISKGTKKNVVIHCRLNSCPDHQILEYFLQRLTGEVDSKTFPVSKVQVLKSKTLTKDDMTETHGPMGMSKEKQWKLHQEIKAKHEKYKKQKPWKQLSEEEKDKRTQEMIKQARRSQ